ESTATLPPSHSRSRARRPDRPLRASARRNRSGRAAAQTAARSRACASTLLGAGYPVGLLACRLVVRIRRCALEPDVAAVEILPLPDRPDLFDALDRIPGCSERIRPVRRSGGDDDAGLANLEPADAMVHRESGRGPQAGGLIDNPPQRAHRERLVR